MNNEEKEWLRDRVNRWADSDLRHYEGSESVCHDVQQDRYTLIALIDRQPSDDQEKEKASSALAILITGCSGWRRCSTCSVHDACKQGIDIIRKALGIEEG